MTQINIIKEKVEGWYFDNEFDAQEQDIKKAVGYIKTLNGVFACEWGVQTKYKFIKGQTGSSGDE